MPSKLARIVADLAPLRYRELRLVGPDTDWIEQLHQDGLGDRVGLRTVCRGTAEEMLVKPGRDVLVIVDRSAPATNGELHRSIHRALILNQPEPDSLPDRFTLVGGRSSRIALDYVPPLPWEKLDRHQLKIIRPGLPRWVEPVTVHGQRLRRWTSHKPTLSHLLTLSPEHPAIRERRTLFRKRITTVEGTPRLLISGSNSRKIGGTVVKGKWAGMPIFTLTLEERRTCWSGCAHYLDCYGNKMNWSRRIEHGPALEARLETELRRLNREHPGGFVVRLHALGDFYSAKYVRAWVRWLRLFPALHAFGYSSWPTGSVIGKAVGDAVAAHWDRFAIRFSNQDVAERGAITIYREPVSPRIAEGIVCPAQTDRTECCGTCALCWQTQANIVFVAH